jgi:hypothetical protein
MSKPLTGVLVSLFFFVRNHSVTTTNILFNLLQARTHVLLGAQLACRRTPRMRWFDHKKEGPKPSSSWLTQKFIQDNYHDYSQYQSHYY